jgi:peptidoglycan/LPS O-acetylase OafA/YrhL
MPLDHKILKLNKLNSNNSNVQEKIGIVEAIRGLAAFAVCIFHFSKSNIVFLGNSIWFQKIASYGWLGVEAFFVISGFIIPYSMVKGGYQLRLFFRFLIKRCLRIEPPYILSFILVIAIGCMVVYIPGFRGEKFQFNALQTISHIAYLPEHLGFKWLLPIYWTLEAEFHFYILIGLSLPFIWKSQTNFFLGLAIALVSSFYFRLYVFSFMPLFVMGISVAAFKLGRINQWMLWMCIVSSVIVSILKGHDPLMPIVGIFVSLLVSYCEIKTLLTDYLGKISFSLYLLHLLSTKIINFGGRFTDNALKVWLVLMTALIVTLILSWIFYVLVERPSQRLSKRIIYSNYF